MRRLQLPAVLILLLAIAACNEDGTIEVHRLSFEGVKSVDESRLRQALATRENSKVPIVGWELPWSQKHTFEQSRLDEDVQRIQAFYSDRGFPDARAKVDLKINAKQTAVDITVTVTEGDPVKVASVDFVGFEAVPEKHLAQLKRTDPLVVGHPRDRDQVVTAQGMALNELRDHGYPYAKVTTDENDGPDGKSAAIALTAVPGPLSHFGSVEVAGNKSVSEHVIARELSYNPGDLYQRSLVQGSQRRLYGMELFQFVNIETLNPENEDPQVDTRVTVAEGKHQRMNFGVGYGTEEKGRVDAEYHHLNFLGGARTAGVHARYSSLDRGLRLDFTQPYFLAQHFSAGAQAQQWYTYTPAYNSIVTGGKLTLTHRSSPSTSWSVFFSSERDNSTIADAVRSNPALINDLIALGLNPSTDHQEGTSNAIGFDVQRSTADNLLNAHHGYQLALHVEQAGQILPGTFKYNLISVDGRQYLPLGSRVVVASRVQFGNITADDDQPANVPFGKKYFLGGASSLRGWGTYEVSPIGESGIPLGGNSMLAVSEEFRTGVGGSFGVVLFGDAGNVWPGSWQMTLGDLRYDVGPGLRYQTPVGPIRLDFGYQLNVIDGLLVNGAPQTRRWRIHFSIGQAF